MKKVLIIFLITLFVGACIGVTVYLYMKEQKNPVVYKTESPFLSTVYKKTVATGSIEPRKEVIIKPQASGIVEKIFVKAGQEIKKGTVIAKIRIIPDMHRLNDAQTNVNSSTINFELAEAEMKRQKQLFEEKVISHIDYIKYEQDFKIRKEHLESAKSNLDLIMRGSSQRIKKTTTEVKATIDGRILDIPIKEGGNVIQANNFNDGTTIATLANMNDLIFKGKIVESEVGKLREGMDLNLIIGALPDQVFKAKLEFISSKGVEDKGAVQFEVKAGINQEKGNASIRAGYSANADIILDKKENVWVINEKNIEFNKDSAFIYLEKEPQNFIKTQIKTGLSDDMIVEILGGITKNQKFKILENH